MAGPSSLSRGGAAKSPAQQPEAPEAPQGFEVWYEPTPPLPGAPPESFMPRVTGTSPGSTAPLPAAPLTAAAGARDRCTGGEQRLPCGVKENKHASIFYIGPYVDPSYFGKTERFYFFTRPFLSRGSILLYQGITCFCCTAALAQQRFLAPQRSAGEGGVVIVAPLFCFRSPKAIMCICV